MECGGQSKILCNNILVIDRNMYEYFFLIKNIYLKKIILILILKLNLKLLKHFKLKRLCINCLVSSFNQFEIHCGSVFFVSLRFFRKPKNVGVGFWVLVLSINTPFGVLAKTKTQKVTQQIKFM
jgi:hypothetical protein